MIAASLPANGPMPGLQLSLSTQFLNAAFAPPIDKSSSVDVIIDKYHIHADGKTTGAMSFQPLPSDDRWHLRMTMSGELAGCASAQVRKPIVYTFNRAPVRVEQEVFVSPVGIRASEPAIWAPTRSTFQSADTGRPPLRHALINGAARLQFRVVPERGDRIATQVSEIALRTELDRDIARANRTFQERVLGALRELDVPVSNLRLSSTAHNVQLNLAVPDTRPPAAPAAEPADLKVRIHQDVLNRLMRQIYGGAKRNGMDLETEAAQVLSLLGSPRTGEPVKQPWSITFNKQAPIVFRLENNTVRIQMAGDGFTFFGLDYPAMTATILYDLKHDEAAWRAIRRTVEIKPPNHPDGGKLTSRQEIIKNLLYLKAVQIMPREIVFANLGLITALAPQARGKVSRIVIRDGWLVLEWKHMQ